MPVKCFSSHRKYIFFRIAWRLRSANWSLMLQSARTIHNLNFKAAQILRANHFFFRLSVSPAATGKVNIYDGPFDGPFLENVQEATQCGQATTDLIFKSVIFKDIFFRSLLICGLNGHRFFGLVFLSKAKASVRKKLFKLRGRESGRYLNSSESAQGIVGQWNACPCDLSPCCHATPRSAPKPCGPAYPVSSQAPESHREGKLIEFIRSAFLAILH